MWKKKEKYEGEKGTFIPSKAINWQQKVKEDFIGKGLKIPAVNICILTQELGKLLGCSNQTTKCQSNANL